MTKTPYGPIKGFTKAELKKFRAENKKAPSGKKGQKMYRNPATGQIYVISS